MTRAHYAAHVHVSHRSNPRRSRGSRAPPLEKKSTFRGGHNHIDWILWSELGTPPFLRRNWSWRCGNSYPNGRATDAATSGRHCGDCGCAERSRGAGILAELLACRSNLDARHRVDFTRIHACSDACRFSGDDAGPVVRDGGRSARDVLSCSPARSKHEHCAGSGFVDRASAELEPGDSWDDGSARGSRAV